MRKCVNNEDFWEIGSKFGEYSLSKIVGKDDFDNRIGEFQCKCGHILVTPIGRMKTEVRLGKRKCQNCISINTYVGKTIGKLTIIKQIESKFGMRRFKCICECGNNRDVFVSFFRKANLVACEVCVQRNIKRKNSSVGDITSHNWNGIIARAKTSGFDFNLSKEFLWNLFLKQDRKCAISGVDLCMHKIINKYDIGNEKNKSYVIRGNASVDRIDSTKGYLENNVQWIHKEIQTMKWNRTDSEFIQWCIIIAENNKNKKVDL